MVRAIKEKRWAGSRKFESDWEVVRLGKGCGFKWTQGGPHRKGDSGASLPQCETEDVSTLSSVTLFYHSAGSFEMV